MSSNSPIRFGAAICVYDDHQWLKLVLDSIYDGCDRIFALVGSQPWYGEAADNADTLAVFEGYTDPEGKIEIIRGDWATEADQRNAGLEICEQNECEICFVVDADEIYDPSELEQMMKIVRATPQIDCFTLGLHTYWKSQRNRIDPPEPLQPPVFVRVGRSRFTHNRAVEAKLSALIDPSVGVCHHMSYARTDEQIKKKISNFSHANEIVPGWYERVWLGWNLNRTMRNLHPTHPGAYSQAVEVAEASLPAVLRGCTFEFEATEQPWQPLSGSHACLAMDGSDLHGESAAWQRYLFFRPWYDGKRVVDLGCGEGFGTAYMATLAQSATGIETDRVTLSHALRRYEHASFLCEDLASTELKDVDLTVSFDVLDSLANVDSILSSIASSGCDWIGSTSRPDVAEAIGRAFCDREVRWLWQEATWPYSIVDDEPNASLCAIAVVGDREIPRWPSIGISIPTVNAGSDIVDAVVSMSRSYPGLCEFAVTANGCGGEALEMLDSLRESLPERVHILRQDGNLGYGAGSNLGLHFLQERGGFEYFAVSNDDVIPATDCICELVSAMQNLELLEKNPGVIGPMSNIVNGSQQIDLGSMDSYLEMLYRADRWRIEHHDAAFETSQVRGLFMLIHPRCLEMVGGFDPQFGLGNCEDDDHNVRTHYAGFTLWIAEGAFLYHSGSQTFRSLEVDYKSIMRENAELFARKWQAKGGIDHYEIEGIPEGVELFIPLTQRAERTVEPAA